MQVSMTHSAVAARALTPKGSSAPQGPVRVPTPAAAATCGPRLTLRAHGTAFAARRQVAHRMQANADNMNAGAFDNVYSEEDLANLSDEDRERIDTLVSATMEKIKGDPEATAKFQDMVQKVQQEQTKDPAAFKQKMKQAQEMQMLQMRSFIFQVMKLDKEDPEVGHVVKDLIDNGETAFEKYMTDQALGQLLQTKCMVKAITDMLMKIDPSDPELGFVRTKLEEEGAAYAETVMQDQTIMLQLTKRAVLDDPYSLHGATRVGDLETMKYVISAGRDVNADGNVDLNGAAPLHIAAAAGLVEAAELLLENGAILDNASPATQGNSPLHFAVGYGQPKMVDFLLSKGANKYGTNGNGQLPSEMAELLEDVAMKDAVLASLN